MAKIDLMKGKGILSTEHDGHAYRRSLVAPTFVGEQVQKYGDIITGYGLRVRDGWHDGQTMNIESEMGRLSLLISVRLLLGLDMDSDGREIGSIMARFMKRYNAATLPRLMFQKVLTLLPIGNAYGLTRVRKELERYIMRTIEERRRDDTPGDDILASMMSARDGQGREGAMSDEQLLDESVSMLLAGHDPLAKALTWTWYLVSQNPGVREKLHNEIDSVLKGEAPVVSDIERLKYTYDVFREAMRLYPPVWIMVRQALGEYEVRGYTLPPKCLVVVSPYVIHRNPESYGDPLEFRPERWGHEQTGSIPEFSYIPFGGGSRVCTGEPLSWIQGVILVAAIAQKWKLDFVESHPVSLKPSITLGTKYGIKMVAEKRDG